MAWQAANYNDSSWPSGPALLGVEDCNCLPAPGLGTRLTIGRITYYFRTSFVVNTNLTGFNLNLRTILDDGAVVYLNGTRILSDGMGTGTPAYADRSSRNVSNVVDLTGMSLTDDPAFGRKWIFPPASILAPSAWRWISTDPRQPASAANAGFGLSLGGGAVYFYNTPAHQGALVDALHYGLQIPNFSVGRIPNGTGNWTLTIASPGQANAAAGLAPVNALRLNEWMADPATGSDWFEV